MVEFVIELSTEIADFLLDLWVNKIVNKFGKKKNEERH